MSRLQLPKLMYINDSEEALLKCFNHFANLLKVVIGVSTPENSCMQKQNNFTTSFLLLLPPYCMQVIFLFSQSFFFLSSHNQKMFIVQRTCLEAVNKLYFFFIIILKLCLSSAVCLCLNVIIQDVFNNKRLNLQKYNLFLFPYC